MKPSSIGASYRPLPNSGSFWWERQQHCLVRIIATAILVLLALPFSAVARPGYEVHPGGIELILPVEKRAGTVISVSANERQRVRFVVDGMSSTTEYSTKGRISSRHIEANFGSLGHIDVRLNFAKQSSDPPHKGRCKGRGPRYQEGTYRGAMEFSLPEDVPTVSNMQGRVYLERRFRQVCKRQHSESQPGGMTKLKHKLEVGFLTVGGKSEGHTVLLEASILALRGNPARSAGYLSVVGYERREAVRIAKTTGASIDHDSFAMSGRGEIPETVAVELPKPFAGHALYSRSPGSSPSWTGDLSVELPDADWIPLTGPGFSPVFCRGPLMAKAKFEPCL